MYIVAVYYSSSYIYIYIHVIYISIHDLFPCVGVHHLVDAAEQLIQRYEGKIQLLVGGRVVWNDPYSAYCGHKLEHLKQKYPSCIWANPNEFFTDGVLVNLGADVGVMPSKFEPGGIVQHEFFIAGTPVLGDI